MVEEAPTRTNRQMVLSSSPVLAALKERTHLGLAIKPLVMATVPALAKKWNSLKIKTLLHKLLANNKSAYVKSRRHACCKSKKQQDNAASPRPPKNAEGEKRKEGKNNLESRKFLLQDCLWSAVAPKPTLAQEVPKVV